METTTSPDGTQTPMTGLVAESANLSLTKELKEIKITSRQRKPVKRNANQNALILVPVENCFSTLLEHRDSVDQCLHVLPLTGAMWDLIQTLQYAVQEVILRDFNKKIIRRIIIIFK